MRILILQLARFGDIYQTWPTFHALKRIDKDCEVHVLVRERFKAGMEGTEGIQVHEWPSAKILAPIYNSGDVTTAIEELNSVIEKLNGLKFDRIVNLSFSPMASYLTDILSDGEIPVTGYTRHSDGHLHIPDDTSAYFYAQVGVGRANRYHLTDLFATVAAMDLVPADFRVWTPLSLARQGVTVHLGASKIEKTYPPEMWATVITGLLDVIAPTETVTLVGGREELNLANAVAADISNSKLINLVGDTTLSELLDHLQGSRLLIGADSGPVHMAALTNTPVLNLSCAAVNFWETGPRSAGSRILFAKEAFQIMPSSVVKEARSMLNGDVPIEAVAYREEVSGDYICQESFKNEFTWSLVQALYTGADYPEITSNEDKLAFQRLFELTELAIHHLEKWENPKFRDHAVQALGEIDVMFNELGKLNQAIGPILEWFQVERLRIPPGTEVETLYRTRTAFQSLALVSSVYRTYGDQRTETKKAIALCRDCAPELREYAFSAVQERFQTLVATFHELARYSTNIGDANWSSVLESINGNLERRDYIGIADQFEWELAPALEATLNESKTL